MSFNYEKKIGALLAKAEDPGVTEHEREALMDKAYALMVRTGVEEAQARAAHKGSAVPEKIVTRMVRMNGMYHLGFRSLGIYVANALGGLVYYSSQVKQTETMFYIVGFENDAVRAQALLESLMRQAFTAMQTWWKTQDAVLWGAQGAKKARRSFIVSFGMGVRDKLNLVYGEVIEETKGAELAIRDRQAQVNDWVEKHLNLRERKGGFEAHVNAVGVEAGRSADIGQSAMHGASAEIGRA